MSIVIVRSDKTNKIEKQRFIETNLHVRKSPPLTPLYFSSSVCTVQVNLTRNKCSKGSKSHRKKSIRQINPPVLDGLLLGQLQLPIWNCPVHFSAKSADKILQI